MNRNTIVIGIIVLIVIIAGVSLYLNSSGAPASTTSVAVTQAPAQVVTNSAPISTSSAVLAVPLMQSTEQQFSQYAYYSKAHEVYPVLAADTTKALGAFSFSKTSLGTNEYRITLTNNAEGYKGQSVVVGNGQSVYFIERSTGDDSDTEDSITTDDILVAVDAQGNILK